MGVTFGVDVGGTKIAAGAVDAEGRIVDEERIPTPGQTPESIEDGIVAVVQRLRERHGDAPVGIAAAGFVDAERSTVRFAPNLPWRDRPLRDNLMRGLGLPVIVENDANAAAWGEFRFGAGRDCHHMVLLTVGTGLGGGIVLDGQLLRGAFGAAGELGHIRMVPAGRLCGCGKRGCFEKYVSGSALVVDGRELLERDPVAGARMLELAGGDIARLKGNMISQAAVEGDPAAVGLLAAMGRWLGIGIADVADVLDPSVVVVGGGVADVGDLMLEPARESYLSSLSGAEHRTHLVIRAAQLGNEAGMIGAAALATTT